MQLGELVVTSSRVAKTRSRLEKVAQLAGCLARLGPDEVAVGVALLAGEMRQGRIGIGYAAIRQVQPPPSAAPTLALLEVDRAFARLLEITGPGSKAAKLSALEGALG